MSIAKWFVDKRIGVFTSCTLEEEGCSLRGAAV
jgi:hypothetical protein